MLLQHRLVFVDLFANLALVFRIATRLVLAVRPRVRGIVMVRAVVLFQAVDVVEGPTASVASMILHKIVHGRVSGQCYLVGKDLAADLANELRFAMVTLPVSLDVVLVDSHERALPARRGLCCVTLFHVRV